MSLSSDLKASKADSKHLSEDAAAQAEVLTTLASRIGNAMSDVEVTAVKAGLEAVATRLLTLGHDPVEPVPAP